MSSRFPTPKSLTDEQKLAIEEAERTINTTFGGKVQIRDNAGNLLGPFAALLYTPRTFVHYLTHITNAVTTPLLTPRERELATLASTSITKSGFVIYAHKKVALTLGITTEQIQDLIEGEVPKDLSEREALVVRLASQIASSFGNLTGESWATGEVVLGKEVMSALVQYVASYLHAATLVNAANIPVRES